MPQKCLALSGFHQEMETLKIFSKQHGIENLSF